MLTTLRPPGRMALAVQILHCRSSRRASGSLTPAKLLPIWISGNQAGDWMHGFLGSKASLWSSALPLHSLIVILLPAELPVRGAWPGNEVCDMSYTVQYLESEMASQGIEVSVLVNCLVQDAIHLSASDLHIEPWENAIAVRARVNGVLTEVAHLPLDLMEKISMRFKVMSNLVTYQAGTPQDGTAVGGPELDGVQLRVSIFPTTRGEKIVVRLFDPRDRRFELDSLGFEESTLHGLLRALKRTSGLLLFTGPTGSGKTSTMYSALCYIMQRDGTSVSISTVEDPVEFNLPMVSQTQISPAQEFTYAIALRSIMRQDPQVIMVGEIRDAETAAIAVQAGLTGHLVLSTIHCGVSAGAFTRLINMEIEPFMLASSILAVMGLRLVRTVCPNCAQTYEPAPSQLKVIPEALIPEAQFRQGAGCEQCHQTGYSGRVPVSELLVVNEPFREAVLKKMPTSALEEIAIQQGMCTLWQNGLARAIAGQTTLEETIRVLAADMM
jgi:type II secretory ATPase GspE/PulE/Tfp pilus assembly ATPase PilB-like protein